MSSIGGNMNYIYGNTLVLGDSSYLEHHGILGQKWGVRRFQNPDGTRTEAGRKRYSNSNELKGIDNINKYKGVVGKDKKERIEILQAVAQDVITPFWSSNDGSRLSNAADLGVKALKKMEPSNFFSNEDNEMLKEWFLEEDQTYGMCSISDLINQGYSSKNCKDLLDIVKKNDPGIDWDDGDDQRIEDICFNFNLGNYNDRLKRFADYCESEKNSMAQSGFFVEDDTLYLAHHGILGQKWGVRRFQNKDGTHTKAGKARDLKNTIVLKKGSTIKRTTPAAADWRNGRRMYVSIDNDDAKKWRDFFSRHYVNPHEHTYKVKRDLYIATGKEITDIINREFKSKADRQQFSNDVQKINLAVSKEKYRKAPNGIDQTAYDASSLMRSYSSPYSEYNTESGKRIVKALTDSGFDGLIDSFGQDVSKSPVILLDPEKKVKRKTTKSVREIQFQEAMGLMTHSSIGGNINYIYGNTLVLGDSSYLEHHGIKNQKWGVRRFQNPDGSLTAAGRIRYGVTGAAKAAFKVGKKLGAATASVARAGVKKAKEDAYAKKKEKASQTREGVLKNKKMFTNEELERLEKRFKIEDDMRNAGLRHGQEIAKTISAYSDAAVKTMNALQTGGKAVKAISDGLSALQDYKEKTSNKPPNDDNPPNNGGGGGSKKQAEHEAAQEAIYAKRKADLDSRESDLKQREDYVNTRYDALLKVSKQRQSEQDARDEDLNRRDEDLNRRDKAASEREEKLKSAAKGAVEVMNKLKERKDNLDRREADLNNIADTLDSEIGYRIDTISELRKTLHDDDDDDSSKKKKNAKHSAIGEEIYTDHLEHHGIKGQRWGVRRFQNADGSLTDKGRKHYQKKLAIEERKLTAANAARGQYERVRTPMSVGMGILGAVAGAMVGVPAGPAGIAAGAAVVSSIAASSNYAAYTVAGIVAGHGAKRNMKKIAKYKEALAQDAFEIQNGVLIYGSGQSEELKHFGLKGMKWGVRRFQNPDGSLTDTGKKRYSNTGELDSGGKYKEEANTARVYREREKAKENRAIKNGNRYDAEAARSWQDLYSQSEKAMNSAYRKSIAGRYDALKAKRKKRYAKHSAFVKDGTLFLEYRGTNFSKR